MKPIQNLTGIYRISNDIVNIVKGNYIDAFGFDSSLATFTWNVEFDGESYELVFNLPKEWKWVEDGRKPGPYPFNSNKGLGWVKSIINWIDVKKIVPRNEKGLPSDIARNNFAWAVTKKIQRYGYKGRHILEKSFNDDKMAQYVDDLAVEITKLLSREVDEAILTIADDLTTMKVVSHS